MVSLAARLSTRAVKASGSHIALGIVGAIVGGVLFSALGMQGITGLNICITIVAIVGAVVVLFGYHAVAGRR